MTPAMIELLISAAIKYGPALALEIVGIFKKQNPTLADLEALFGKMKTYDDYLAAARAAVPSA